MDFQKFVNNSYLTIITGLVAYGVTNLDKIREDVNAVRQMSYENHAETQVQKQLNQQLADIARDLEMRLRFLEKRGPG